MRSTEKAEDEAARAKVRSLLAEPFDVDRDEKVGGIALDTLRNTQFAGQIARDGERVLYASLIANKTWLRNAGWREAPAFSI